MAPAAAIPVWAAGGRCWSIKASKKSFPAQTL